MTAWCWVQPHDALTGAVVRCCERPWCYFTSPGRTSRREGYFPCRHHGERYRFYIGWPFCLPHRHGFGVCSARAHEGLPGEQPHVPGCL